MYVRKMNHVGGTKFYGIVQSGNTVIINFGPSGSDGRTIVKKFKTPKKAETFAADKFWSKYVRGYNVYAAV